MFGMMMPTPSITMNSVTNRTRRALRSSIGVVAARAAARGDDRGASSGCQPRGRGDPDRVSPAGGCGRLWSAMHTGADVLVVGGGVIGLAIAREAARAGAAVPLLA